MPSTIDLRQSDAVVGAVDDAVTVIDAAKLMRGSAADRQAIIEQIRMACTETGFFYIDKLFENSPAMATVLTQMQNFFDLDDDDPIKQGASNQNKSGTYGWMPMGGEPAYQPGTIAHVESFDCGREYDAPEKALEGQNAWPQIEGFREAMLAYWEQISDVGDAVLSCLSEAAGLDAAYLPGICNSQQHNTMRLLHYPASNKPANEGDVGIAAHTDFECITLIMQTRPGLELTDVNGRWYDAPGHDGRIVVLLDDMLERLTNGLFRATGHRVRTTGEKRYSVVMFFAVNDDVVVEPLPQFVSALNPGSYAPVTQRAHIDGEIERAQRHREATAREA